MSFRTDATADLAEITGNTDELAESVTYNRYDNAGDISFTATPDVVFAPMAVEEQIEQDGKIITGKATALVSLADVAAPAILDEIIRDSVSWTVRSIPWSDYGQASLMLERYEDRYKSTGSVELDR